MRKEILVGSTGFVGTNLKLKHQFDLLCNSKNIEEAYGTNPDLLVYAGIPAQKFIANQNEEEDLKIIENAILNIQKIHPKKLVLISTIDVFKDSNGVTEEDETHFETKEAYGKNRRFLEEWVIKNIDDYLIVRLPGLYGKNIKKNFIYDVIHFIPNLLKEEKLEELATKNKDLKNYYEKDQNGFYRVKELSKKETETLIAILKSVHFSALNFTESRGIFQFYNLAYLWEHIEIAIQQHLKVLHLAVEPVSISELYQFLYQEKFQNEFNRQVPYYNFKTKYDFLFSGKNGYIFEKQWILEDIKKFIEEEQKPKLKFAISNIAWEKEFDQEVYNLLNNLGIKGLEIAPTRIVEEAPYEKENIQKAKKILEEIRKYQLQVISMQSIWYGHKENIFESQENYEVLKEYTYQAILYAEAIGCKNLVFGCPKNRNMKDKEKEMRIAIRFFNEIGHFAEEHGVIIALEPNPQIYGTNFLNTTEEVVQFIKQLSTNGVKINYDLGTVIENQEDLSILKENIEWINHIHISEPNLKKIEKRDLHRQLLHFLKEVGYNGYISIEIGQKENVEEILEIFTYLLNI